MAEESTAIRDFIYLDWERVRSIAAQLFKGVPQDVATQGDRTRDGKLGFEASALGFLKGQVGGDLRFVHSEKETRSVHHYTYSLVESRLRELNRLSVFGPGHDIGKWRQGFFRDGQFILATGLVRVMDYGWIASMLEAIPKMAKSVQSIQESSLKQKKGAGSISQAEYVQALQNVKKSMQMPRASDISDITGLLRQVYGDIVRIKVVPNRQYPDRLFVGSGALANFTDTPASLSQKYGYEVDAGWVAFGQVNISAASDLPVPLPIGNQMEDSVEVLSLALNGLMRVAASPTFPAVSFTPICIYRES